jgi:hypothetical protein
MLRYIQRARSVISAWGRAMNNIPEVLKGLKHWVMWKFEIKNDKQTKVPYQPNRQNARSNNPDTWVSYSEAISSIAAFDGIGFCLLNSNLAAFDIDDCRDATTGVIHNWATELVTKANSYTEITVSGTGLRIIGWGTGIRIHRKQKVVDGITLETYRKAERYIVMTGNILTGVVETLNNIDEIIDATVSELDAVSARRPNSGNGQMVGEEIGVPQSLKAMLFHRNEAGYASRSELFCAFVAGCLRKRISNEIITSATLDDQFIGCAIYEHVQDNRGENYVKKQIEKITQQMNLGPLEIKVIDGQISKTVDMTQDALLASERPIFVRGGVLVEPIWSKFPTTNGIETTVTVFRQMAVENVKYMLNKHGVIFKRYDGRLRHDRAIDPPNEVINTLLKLGHWKFPRVAGIINAPTMRPDGTIVLKRGYDQITQFWCWPDERLLMPQISRLPSQGDAQRELNHLKELLSGFAFGSKLDLSVALAAIFTTVLRGAFDIAPMVLFLAHVAGTGKSYLVDLISTIVRGRPCPVIAASRNEEEMEKRLGALLIESAPIISLDNLSFDLNSDVLCQMCTQRSIKTRVLGKSETPECEWKGTLFATGNNIRLVGDLTRRSLICNLDAGIERPELRQFDFDPIKKVLFNQGKYISAVLTIARAYFVTENKCKCQSIGSFENWSKFVREPLLWLGESDPLDSMEQARRDDPNKDAAERLVEQWSQHLGTEHSYKINEIVEKAKETQPGSFDGTADWVRVRPDFYDLLIERVGERGNIDIRRLGYWLRSIKGQIHNNFSVVVVSENKAHGHRWKLDKRV